jgi:hypothetical protein
MRRRLGRHALGGGDGDTTRRSRVGLAMTFHSILHRHDCADTPMAQAVAPQHFRDLNLDHVVAAVTAGRDEYDLALFFYRPLGVVADIHYRQQVMRDLEDTELFARMLSFAGRMQEMHSRLRAAEQAYYEWHKRGWQLDAAATYCVAVRQLAADLNEARPASDGLLGLRDWLNAYTAAADFASLADDTERLAAALRTVDYALVIRGLAVTVRKYQGEPDYSAEIEAVFAKFRQGDVKNYLVNFPEYPGMGHVEAQIVELVAKLYPEIFGFYKAYCENHENFIEPTLRRFEREIQFYISYRQFIDRLRAAGLPFCYPVVECQAKSVHGNDVFDLALAARLVAENRAVVPNDFFLQDGERVLVVSGPNQGGKTTLGRTIGQLHYLASLGCPVPGSDARVTLCDRILTHFEKEEHVATLRGKLQDDLLRMREVLEQATPSSLVVVNEIFASTALEDAVFLATEILQRIIALGCLGVCVTFLDELSRLGPAVVSMVSTVDPDDPARRTFKLVRRPADGRAYALAIARKHRLTYPQLKARLAS